MARSFSKSDINSTISSYYGCTDGLGAARQSPDRLSTISLRPDVLTSACVLGIVLEHGPRGYRGRLSGNGNSFVLSTDSTVTTDKLRASKQSRCTSGYSRVKRRAIGTDWLYSARCAAVPR